MRPLEREGYKIDVATDYPSFQQQFSKNRYNLFVVDLILPQKPVGETLQDDEFISMPGLRIIEEIAKKNRPIIVLSVVSEAHIYDQLNKIGNVVRILNKGTVFPSDFKEIVDEVMKMF
jgi:DNA-binding response OmpR family regulator